MRPVDQTREGATGNCYCAAIASILEVPLESLPDIVAEEMHGRDWHTYVAAYLFKHHGLMALELDGRLVPYVSPRGFHIISGTSPRNPEWGHAVVGLFGELLHDPHPSRAGVAKVTDYTFLVPVALDAIEDEEQRQRLTRWLTRAPCICPACDTKGS